MNDSPALSTLDRTRLRWASLRYDFWLDLHSVPRAQRTALRAELNSSLHDAASDVGLRPALAKVGSLRHLAANMSREGQLRSRWVAGLTAAISALVISFLVFLLLTMYYAEGVLDANANESVASSLFPYFGSKVTVDPSQGLEFTMQPGPLPLVLAIAVWLLVAAPWRSLVHRSEATAGAEAL